MELPAWLTHILVLGTGVMVLGVGGEFLVRGAARLALLFGVSPLVIGLTIVAFGTSAPEAAVTIFAAADGATDLAVGNVVGSNIANILLILGVAAVVQPLPVSRSLIRVDGPIMVLTAAALVALAMLVGRVDRWAGGIFLLGLGTYTGFTYWLAKRSGPPAGQPGIPARGLARYTWFNLLLVAVGVGGLVYGARLIVSGATGIAQLLDISEHVIGLTVVAIGTSLPELATTVVAARHKQPDIAIGNVVGSNIFNVLFVTGLAALTHPLPIPAAVTWFDAPVMLAICVVSYPMMYYGRCVQRWHGVLLLAGYMAYLAWNVRAATPA